MHFAHVLVRQTRRFEDRSRVQLGARLGCTDRDGFAFEIRQGLDARFLAGHDLDVIGIGTANGTQFGQRRFETGVFHAVFGIGNRVTQCQRQFASTGLQQVQVFHRSLGGLD
ncbi:hypothetical protein D3C81_648940 [compost metagenome]